VPGASLSPAAAPAGPRPGRAGRRTGARPWSSASRVAGALLLAALPSRPGTARGDEPAIEIVRTSAGSGVAEVELPRLWLPRRRPGQLPDIAPTLRGLASWRQFRPGLEASPDLYRDEPRLLPEGGAARRLTLVETVAFGLDNVDRDALLRRYPETRASHLVGGDTGLRQLLRVQARGPLLGNAVYFHAEARDYHRLDQRPLGAREGRDAHRPRLTLNLSWYPTGRSKVTLGGRHETLRREQNELSTLRAPDATSERNLRENTLVVTAQHQPGERTMLRLVYDLVHHRDDSLPRGGLDRPGHRNLDAQYDWGNAAWTRTSAFTEYRLHGTASWFGDDLLARGDAHTLTAGASLERRRGRIDHTRNGGFTFVDAATDQGEVTEDDRMSWSYSSSDRGNEVHAGFQQRALAVFLEDDWELGRRLRITGGARFEQFTGGFPHTGAVWQTTALSPRLTALLHLDRQQRTGLFAQLGRHARRLVPAMYLRASAGAAYSPLEYWRWSGDPHAASEPGVDDPGWYRERQFPAIIGPLAPDLRHPRLDRAAVGLFHEAPHRRYELRLRYELERHRDLLALHDAAASIRDPDSNPTGSHELVEEQFGPAPHDLVRYLRARDGHRPQYLIGNPAGAHRDVHRLVMAAAITATPWLHLSTRATWTRDRGNLDDRDGLSLEWRDPSGRLQAEGNLPGVHRLRLDLGGRVTLPLSSALRATYRFRSGTYHARHIRVVTPGAPRMYVHDPRGRGGYQYPSQHIVDLHLQSRLDWLGAPRWLVWLTGENLLNQGAVSAVRSHSTAFRAVRALQEPLQLWLGLRCDL
jgi:hypothetical protein